MSAIASDELHQLLGEPWPFPGRPSRHELGAWTVTDDWPERVLVTDAEVDVFEAWSASAPAAMDIAELNKCAAETDLRLTRPYDAIESGASRD